jgi:hypothetical protein
MQKSSNCEDCAFVSFGLATPDLQNKTKVFGVAKFREPIRATEQSRKSNKIASTYFIVGIQMPTNWALITIV